jgi:hypothetical protein
LRENPVKFIIPLQQVDRVFHQFDEKSRFVGGVAHNFCLPLFVLERKSMSGGTLFSCQHQLMGGLRCIVASLVLVENKLALGLPTTAYGMSNVGNYIELWSMTPMDDTVRTPPYFCESG